ncbi:MAG: hypothetical protein IPL49_03605 [Saprospirales bacterium]|nr:hypothetical protein [Saprospirales bacterium]
MPDTTFTLKIEQELPNNTIFSPLTDTIQAPASRMNLHYSFPPLEDEDLVGMNLFRIKVDADDQMKEK